MTQPAYNPAYGRKNRPQSGSVPPPAVYNAPSSSYPTSNPNGNKSGDTMTKIGHVAGKMAAEAGKAAMSAGRKVKNMIDAEGLKGLLKDGNIIQLVSLSSGRTIQILQDQQGKLIIDGQGGIGNQFFNAHFHVTKDPIDHGLRLHNQYNYLAITNGTVMLIHQEPGQKPHPATKFKVKSQHGNSIQFESVNERRRFIEVASNGQIKSAAHSSQESPDAQFSISVVFKVSY